jgi:hypothetical protein
VVALRSLALCVVLTACGTSEDVVVVPDAGADATDTIDVELPPLAETGPLPDLYVDPVVLGDAGGPFLCGKCICDGRTHYCDESTGPGIVVTDAAFGDAAPCSDASISSCTAFPSACAGHPSCECMFAARPGACHCHLDDSGAGLDYGCSYP